MWQRLAIGLYVASSCAAAVLLLGRGLRVEWLPDRPLSLYLGWTANLAIVLAALALARNRAPLRLQLALPFAAPVLYLLLIYGIHGYSGEPARDVGVLMFGFWAGWVLLYSEFMGSVIAFVIALASKGTSTQPGAPAGPNRGSLTFRALGCVVAAAWLYMHAFGVAVNHWPGSKPYLHGAPWRIFQAASVIAWSLSPLWLLGAILLVLFQAMRKQRPASADMAVFLLVVLLIGVYFYLGFQD
ncbi:MAG: hypothetical protein ACJ76J_25895 [Thermoanaerobaculia bacterium]